MWAAFSVVEATLRLIEAVLAGEGGALTRFVLLSGVDYAIASNQQISRFFERNPQREFLRGFDIRGAGDAQLWKMRRRHLRQFAPRYSMLRIPLSAIEGSLRLFPRHLPSDIVFVCGSQWWALTRDCAKYCLDFASSNPDFVKLFRSAFAPDEMFFHTIVHNSPNASKAGPLEPFVDDVIRSGSLRFYSNLHYLPGADAWIRTRDEANAALNGPPGKLFARKFSSSGSVQAMDIIDQSLDARIYREDCI